MDAGGVPNANLATAVWANPARSLTQVGGFIFGETLQPVSVLSSLDMTVVATTQVMTFSGVGCLIVVGKKCAVTVGVGTVNAFIDIVVDGVTSSLALYDTGGTIDPGSAATASLVSGTAAQQTAGDVINWQLLIGFKTSLTVNVRITASTATLLKDTFSVLWAHA